VASYRDSGGRGECKKEESHRSGSKESKERGESARKEGKRRGRKGRGTNGEGRRKREDSQIAKIKSPKTHTEKEINRTKG
jgi:hypothetical protein